MQKKSSNATCLLFGLLLAPVVSAQVLPDPTRPPAGFVDPADLKAGQAAAVPAAPGGQDDAGLVLQSVLLPRQGPAVAVISGRYLPLGARFDDWELRAVNERQVVLVQGRQRRVLKLTPLVSKNAVAPAASEAPAPGRKKAKKAQSNESELKR